MTPEREHLAGAIASRNTARSALDDARQAYAAGQKHQAECEEHLAGIRERGVAARISLSREVVAWAKGDGALPSKPGTIIPATLVDKAEAEVAAAIEAVSVLAADVAKAEAALADAEMSITDAVAAVRAAMAVSMASRIMDLLAEVYRLRSALQGCADAMLPPRPHLIPASMPDNVRALMIARQQRLEPIAICTAAVSIPHPQGDQSAQLTRWFQYLKALREDADAKLEDVPMPVIAIPKLDIPADAGSDAAGRRQWQQQRERANAEIERMRQSGDLPEEIFQPSATENPNVHASEFRPTVHRRAVGT